MKDLVNRGQPPRLVERALRIAEPHAIVAPRQRHVDEALAARLLDPGLGERHARARLADVRPRFEHGLRGPRRLRGRRHADQRLQRVAQRQLGVGREPAQRLQLDGRHIGVGCRQGLIHLHPPELDGGDVGVELRRLALVESLIEQVAYAAAGRNSLGHHFQRPAGGKQTAGLFADRGREQTLAILHGQAR